MSIDISCGRHQLASISRLPPRRSQPDASLRQYAIRISGCHAFAARFSFGNPQELPIANSCFFDVVATSLFRIFTSAGFRYRRLPRNEAIRGMVTLFVRRALHCAENILCVCRAAAMVLKRNSGQHLQSARTAYSGKSERTSLRRCTSSSCFIRRCKASRPKSESDVSALFDLWPSICRSEGTCT